MNKVDQIETDLDTKYALNKDELDRISQHRKNKAEDDERKRIKKGWD